MNEACPGHGVNPAALAALQAYPHSNSAGGDGVNTAGFTWSAPNPISLNTYIAKIDWQASTNHHAFLRGNLLSDRISGPAQFPGDPSSFSQVNTSKGLAAGDTWTITSHLINNFRYGYIRQALNNIGAGNNSFADFAGISPLTGENTTTLLSVPVHNFVDDITWTKGKHTFQAGGNYRLIHNDTLSNAVSFNSATTGSANISNAQIANSGQSFDPAAFGFPAVADSFSSNYDNAVTALAGLLSTINVHNTYKVTSATAATLLPTGTLIPRNFKANEFEYYLQDSWRVRPNLTVTVGFRHTLLQVPYEVNGQQVQPNIDLHQWFLNRAIAAAQGLGNQPEFAFAPSGQSRGGKPFWRHEQDGFCSSLCHRVLAGREERILSHVVWQQRSDRHPCRCGNVPRSLWPGHRKQLLAIRLVRSYQHASRAIEHLYSRRCPTLHRSDRRTGKHPEPCCTHHRLSRNSTG